MRLAGRGLEFDQKKLRQSGSSKTYGSSRVSRRTQFNTGKQIFRFYSCLPWIRRQLFTYFASKLCKFLFPKIFMPISAFPVPVRGEKILHDKIETQNS